MSCDHGYTLRQRERQCPRFFRWRFDDCVFFVFTTRLLKSVSPHRKHTHLKGVKPKFLFDGGHLVLGLASGLEAFSREPPCDSVGALAVRQTPETRGTAWEFLSYYPILPSRYLRDPFTIPRMEKFPVITQYFCCFFLTKVPSTHRQPKAQSSPCSLFANNLLLAIPS